MTDIATLVANALTVTPQVEAQTTPQLPQEVIGLTVQTLHWQDIHFQVGRVYLKLGRTTVKRVMDTRMTFDDLGALVVHVRLQGEQEITVYGGTETADFLVVPSEPKSEPKTRGKAQPVDRKRDRRAADRELRGRMKGSNPAAAKFGPGKKNKK